MSTTPNLELEQWPAGSSTPSVTHNDALQVLDAVLQLSVQDKDLTAPPTTVLADAGKRWIVGAGSTGAWLGEDGNVALCTAADTWRFITPVEGFLAYVRDEDLVYKYTGSAWTLLQAPLSAVVALAITSNDVALNCALGDYYTLTLNANVSTWTISNPPGSGKAQTVLVRIVQGVGPYTVAWDATFKFANGADTTVSTGSGDVDILALTTFNQGTTWEATLSKAHA